MISKSGALKKAPTRAIGHALLLLPALLSTSCGGSAPSPQASRAPATQSAPVPSSAAPVAAAPPVEPPIAELAWGEQKAALLDEVPGSVVERLNVGGADWYRVRPPSNWRSAADERIAQLRPSSASDADQQRWHPPSEPQDSWVSLAGRPGFVETANNDLWVSVAHGATETQLRLTVAFAATSDSPGAILPVAFEAKGTALTGAKAHQTLARALSDHLLTRRELPIAEFALDRLAGLTKTARPELPDSAQRSGDWASLMDLTTGAKSVRAALQSRSKLRSNIDQFRPSLPLASLPQPSIPKHPWPQMLAMLKTPVPTESLAAAAPADFYFVRAANIQALFDILAEVDAWGTPLADMLEGNGERAGLTERYRTQLALPHTALSRLMGPQLIESLAVVGSDPFLRQGSDLTLIFQVKSPSLFRAGLDKNLSEMADRHGPLTQSSSTHQGVTISTSFSKNYAVHTHRASHRGFELVSNSPTALRRVIDTLDGKLPALKNEPDFQYMLARDSGSKHQVLAFAGDRF
ncbi:MAG: hypothetical protein RJA70_4097, partial [Pseudomonadota bacterium]